MTSPTKLRAGSYAEGQNVLILKSSLSSTAWCKTVIHELTHAIQDFYDMSGAIRMHTEADAFICGAITEHALGQRSDTGLPHYERAYEAAEFVYRNKAHAPSPKWMEVYDAVVKEVEKIYTDARSPIQFKEGTGKGKRKQPTEPELIDAAIREIEARSKPAGP